MYEPLNRLQIIVICYFIIYLRKEKNILASTNKQMIQQTTPKHIKIILEISEYMLY